VIAGGGGREGRKIGLHADLKFDSKRILKSKPTGLKNKNMHGMHELQPWQINLEKKSCTNFCEFGNF
jgi:hypothetical protein